MNKAIQRTNKLFKIIGHKNFFTKTNKANFLLPQIQQPKQQILTFSKKFYSDDENDWKNSRRQFNKIPRDSVNKIKKLLNIFI